MISHLVVTSLLGGAPALPPDNPFDAWLPVVKQHLKLGTSNAEDTVLKIYLGAAVRYVERQRGLILITRTESLILDCWPSDGVICTKKRPLQSVSAVKYHDVDGVERTVDQGAYWVATNDYETRIVPRARNSWPAVQPGRIAAISVEMDAGFGSSFDDLDEDLQQCLLLLVGHWEQNREAALTGHISHTLKLAVNELLENFYIPSAG